MHFATTTLAAITIGVALIGGGEAMADLRVGQKAILFDSIDENMKPVSMKDMVDGKPLVLVVSSCS